MSLDEVDIFAPDPAPFEPHTLAFLVQMQWWDAVHRVQLEAIAPSQVRTQRHLTLATTILSRADLRLGVQ